MNIYFTADCHLFHKNILKFEFKSRPFASLDEMHHSIIQNWNNRVKEDSIVYILGDISFGKCGETLEILNQLNRKELVLIRGNHDEKLLRHAEFTKLFSSIHDLLDIKINRKHYVLCHYPLLAWNRSHYGSINLFGHMHSKWLGNNNQLNVGMDCHKLTPVNINEIFLIFEKLKEQKKT